MPIDNFVELLNDEIDGKIRSATLGFSQNGRMVLGGSSGPDGGSGGPPGGFIGKLSQKYVTYDETEFVSSGGTVSLVDNLNHIRYDIAENAADITVLSGFVDENIQNISQNTADISQNTADISQNTADIIVLSGQMEEGGGGGGSGVGGPDTSTDHASARWDGIDGDLLLDSQVLISDLGKTTFPDHAAEPPLNVTERSVEPTTPTAGDIYLDDGTNTASTNPGWRRYTGAVWEDVSASVGGGIDGPVSSTDHAIARWDLTDGDTLLDSNPTIRDAGGLVLPDDAAEPPLNVTERSIAPTSPVAGDIYLDDGTNTASASPGWRRYTGATWEDVSASAGGGGGAFTDLSDTPTTYSGFGNAITAVSEVADGVVFSGSTANLNFDKLALNPTVNEDFRFSKEIMASGIAPNLVIEVPVTTTDRGKIIFRDGPGSEEELNVTVDAYGYKEISTGSGILSFTVGDNSNKVLVVGVAIRGGVTVSSVTFNSVSFIKAGHIQPGSDVRSEIWYLEEPDVGTYDVEVICSAPQSIIFGVTSFYNVKSVGAYSSDSGGATNTLNVVGSETASVVDALALQSSNTTIRVTAGNTEQTELIAHYYPSASLGMSLIDGSNTSDSKWTFSYDTYAIGFLILNDVGLQNVGDVILELEGTKATFKGHVVLDDNVTLSSGTLNVCNKIYDNGLITSPLTISGGLTDIITDVGDMILSAKGSVSDVGKIIFKQGAVPSELLQTPVFDNSAYELQTTDSSHSYPFTVGDNTSRGILVFITRKTGAPGVTAITYNGDSLSLIESSALGSNGYAEAYYLASPDVGTYNLDITRDNSVAVDISIISVYDILSYGTVNAATFSAAPSYDVTEECFAVSCISIYTSNTITVGDNQTTLHNGTYSVASYANAPEDMNYTFSAGAEQLGHIIVKFFGAEYDGERYESAEFNKKGIFILNRGLTVSSGVFAITNSGFVTNLNANYLDGYTATEILSAGDGGGGYGYIFPTKSGSDTPDDHFTSSTLDAKWTVVHGTSHAVDLTGNHTSIAWYDLTTRPGTLLMQVGRGGTEILDLRQDYTLPTNSSIILALSPVLDNSDNDSGVDFEEFWVGLSLNDTDTGWNAGNYTALTLHTAANAWQYALWNGSVLATTSPLSTDGETSAPLAHRIYFRLTRVGTSYYGFLSTNGETWTPLGKDASASEYTNVWIFAECTSAISFPIPIQAVSWILQGGKELDPW